MFLYLHQFFSFEDIEQYLELNLALDGTNGGLLVGNSHNKSGIPMLMKYLDGYRLIAELEGEEYVINAGSTIVHKEVLQEINNSTRDREFYVGKISDLEGITILDCTTKAVGFSSKFLLLDARGSQFVINKYSTARHLHKLEELNNSHGYKYNIDPLKWDF